MRYLCLFAVAPLLAGASSFLPSTPPLVPGPGAVIDALQGFAKAIDAGDRAYLERAFSDNAHGGVACAFDPETGRYKEVPAGGGIVFQDVAADGAMVRASDAKGAITALLEQVRGKDGKLTTRLTSVQANCATPECSWASLDFERSFVRAGTPVKVPMRATALVRYGDGEPHMRIFLWHASPAPK